MASPRSCAGRDALRHVVITGGASGLGLGCALRFARRGDVITLADVDEAAGRTALQRLAREVPGAAARLEVLDLADPASIAAAAARLRARGQPIDVLVNNAGIYPPSQRVLTPEGQELSFAIAHLGHFRLTQALWPLLEAAPAARVVGISSLVQRRARLDLADLTLARGYLPIVAYQQAKLACLLFSLELQRRLARHGSRVASYAAHPGVCRTALGRNRRLAPSDQPWQRLASWLLARGLSHFGQTPENGAASVVEAATSTRYPAGSFIGPSGVLEMSGVPGLSAPGPAAADPALAAGLWDRSEQITGIRWLS